MRVADIFSCIHRSIPNIITSLVQLDKAVPGVFLFERASAVLATIPIVTIQALQSDAYDGLRAQIARRIVTRFAFLARDLDPLFEPRMEHRFESMRDRVKIRTRKQR
jgi:hypothetical protein